MTSYFLEKILEFPFCSAGYHTTPRTSGTACTFYKTNEWSRRVNLLAAQAELTYTKSCCLQLFFPHARSRVSLFTYR